MNYDTKAGLGTQLRHLLELLDGDLEAVYRAEHPFYVPRYTPVMRALAPGAPLSIKAIAEQSGVSHSAASQTVTLLKRNKLVTFKPGADRRVHHVILTQAGKDLLPWLQARWTATQQVANALDSELSAPLSQVLSEAIVSLERTSFADRISNHTQELESAEQ